MLQIQKLNSLIDRYYTDLEFSLEISGLDSHADHWDPILIDRNAYKSAEILIVAAIRHLKYWDLFLQAIIVGCRREPILLETMDLICITFEHVGEFPPLGIIQHTLNMELLKAYCIDLANWLEKYLWGTPDAAFLPFPFVLEYCPYKNTEGVINEILECRGVFADVKEH